MKKADRANELMARGYAPLMRFGHYTVDVVERGERVYFGMFDGKMDAAKMVQKMRRNYPDAEISQGTVSDEEYKMFSGVTPETLELFGGMLGFNSTGDDAKDQAFQVWVKASKSQRSAMRRLIERKGIDGFSEDVTRVLAGFVTSNARQTAGNLHAGEIAQSVKEIPKGEGELKDAAMRLMDYVQNPNDELQAIRGLLFAQYIGGSIASAIVNMTQPITMTMPWLSQYGGVRKAVKRMSVAMNDVRRGETDDVKLDAAIATATAMGILAPHEVHDLMGQAQGRGGLKSGDGTALNNTKAAAANGMARVAFAWGHLFGWAEQINRKSTFIAAYRTAIEEEINDPMQFATNAIAATQGVYNKGNRPTWARGAVGGTLFTFKQYSVSYLEMIDRMARNGPEGKKAALFALGVLFLLSGASGMPGADDLDDLISGVMQRMGYSFDTRTARREFLERHLGSGMARFMERGVSGLPGAPLDVSGRLGLGNLFPGTGMFVHKADYGRDVAELFGPAGDLAKRAFESVGSLLDGDVSAAALTASPLALRNAVKGVEMAKTGEYQNDKKKKVVDVDGFDAAIKAIGFNPNDVKRAQDASIEGQRLASFFRLRKTQITDMWAQGLHDKNQEKVAKAKALRDQWNSDNPEVKMTVTLAQVNAKLKSMRMTKAERIEKASPKEIRRAVGELVNQD